MSGQSLDPVDTMLDLAEFDNMTRYSPSVTSHKSGFIAQPATQQSTPLMPHLSQMNQMSGPSHQYELHKQQTGIVPGAMASALSAVPNMNFAGNMDMAYMNGMNPDGIFDFNTSPNPAINPADLNIDFQSQGEPFFFENAMAPSVDGAASLASQPVVPSQSSSVRYYPGMHTQAAMLKEQQQRQQRQQMELQRQQQAQQQQSSPVSTRPRSKSNQPTDPIVEQKITQLLNSMRSKPASPDSLSQNTQLNLPRCRKDEEDMDEDERLLASEEGKKLSSKERRQLRNKVSARAFRSRRKEYISHLEAEISAKVTENGELRSQNRALMEENKRLSDLTRMLLASPSFSGFLDTLSANAMAAEAQAMQQQQQQPQTQPQQAMPQIKQERQIAKDVNPYAASVHSQQQMGMPMIPEQTNEFNMVQFEPTEASFGSQPQVFAVTEIPEEPAFLSEMLSGKQSAAEYPVETHDKVEFPSLERFSEEKSMVPEIAHPAMDCDPEFSLFSSASSESPIESEESNMDIFGGIDTSKVFARYELVDTKEAENNSVEVMARVERLSAMLDARMDSLKSLAEL